MDVDLQVRDLSFDDLAELDWSGGPTHLQVLAETLAHTFSGEVAMVIITVGGTGRERAIACGAVDFRRHPDAGELWMLSVHPAWQSLGVGTVLITALEQRIRDRGLPVSRISVEHDNPRAMALYRRLGYRPDGTRLDQWPIDGAQTYVTVCTTLAKPFRP